MRVTDENAVITLPVQPNLLYLLRVQVAAKDHIAEVIDINCTLDSSEKEYAVKVLVSSEDSNDHARCGRWFEHYLFFQSGIFDSSVAISTPGVSCRIIADATPLGVECLHPHDVFSLAKKLKNAAKLSTGKKYGEIPVFYGTESALRTIKPFAATKNLCRPSLISGDGVEHKHKPESKVACYGEGFVMSLLADALGYARIDASQFSLVESGFFELVIVDGAGYAPAVNKEHAALARAIERSRSALILAEGVADVVRLKSNTTPRVEECALHDLVKTVPSFRDAEALKTIMVPCVSDCYHYPEFTTMVRKLSTYGYSLCCSDGDFFYASERTARQVLNDENITLYPRLGADGLRTLFRQSGFVLICCSSLHSQSSQYSQALSALFSGSIPVFYGGKAPCELGNILPCFYHASALLTFLRQQSATLLFQKTWVSLLRKTMGLNRSGRVNVLGEFTPVPGETSPPVSLICVSKRPEKLAAILENFSRQKYGNSQYHILWNMNPADQDRILAATKTAARAAGLVNLNVSVVDEQYNIGTCLNAGIHAAEGKYWFKMDDDDYYGKNYVTDMVNIYQLTDADALCKPHGFLRFIDSQEFYLRDTSFSTALSWLQCGQYGTGATLSGKSKAVPLFSAEYRYGCDSHWIETVLATGCGFFSSEYYNFCATRQTVTRSTWKVSKKRLRENAVQLKTSFGDWIDAD